MLRLNIRKITVLISCILIIFSIHGNQPFIYQSVYGTHTIDEPVLIELIHSTPVQRLKKINQYGIMQFVGAQKIPFTRYQHSMGVFILLRMFGASVKQQMAGLLHDVSHTIFSHVGDWIFDHQDGEYSYQDTVHEWYLEKSGVMNILKKYGYTFQDANHKNSSYKMLEQKIPYVCCDRLEYNLTGGLVEGILDEKGLNEILGAIAYSEGNWFFNDQNQAKRFALLSLYLTEHVFASSWNHFLNYTASQAIKRAVEIGLISMDDIYFSTDDIIWPLLVQSEDVIIKKYINEALNFEQAYLTVEPEDLFDLKAFGKFRGIDPFVKTGTGLKHLSDLDTEFKKEFERVKNFVLTGCCFRFVKGDYEKRVNDPINCLQ